MSTDIELSEITVGTTRNENSRNGREPAKDEITANDGNHAANGTNQPTEESRLLSGEQVILSNRISQPSGRGSASSDNSATQAGDTLPRGEAGPVNQYRCRTVLSELNEVVVWRLRLWMVIVLIFVVIAAVIVLSLVLYSVVYEDEDEKFDQGSFTVPQYYSGTIRLVNQNFTAALLSPTSPQSQVLSNHLREQLSKPFSSSPALGRYFSSAGTSAFSNGSVTASYWLKFLMPLEHGQLVHYTLSKEMVLNVLLQQLYDQEPHPWDPLYIDPAFVSLEVGNSTVEVQ
ncbi:hypothetical protein AAFF_G00313200 [Aldrovandia affinis]|uniref:SEA domain-containing protein n=1 Tax=Aldrovandia affinis TaxID=143900 RepID=A0AAD7WR30_9TELE|nr:hypothetical protein AAFF_G00313200 [Aldrovandia affinis]